MPHKLMIGVKTPSIPKITEPTHWSFKITSHCDNEHDDLLKSWWIYYCEPILRVIFVVIIKGEEPISFEYGDGDDCVDDDDVAVEYDYDDER